MAAGAYGNERSGFWLVTEAGGGKRGGRTLQSAKRGMHRAQGTEVQKTEAGKEGLETAQ